MAEIGQRWVLFANARLAEARSCCSERVVALGGFLSLVLFLLANVLILPPFEGFDEPAHYSYISQLSDLHEIPDFRKDRFDVTIERDRAGLPRPYTTAPPFEDNGGTTYASFFRDLSELGRAEAYGRFWTPRGKERSYSPDISSNYNGAASHPPLYYLLMTLPYRLTSGDSPGAALLAVRLSSILLASCSFVFFWLTVRLIADSPSRRSLLCGVATMFYFPSLFYEFARIGPDSLCVTLLSAAFYYLVASSVHGQQRLRDFAGLGIALGLGLISKIYFVAFLGGATVYSFFFGIRVTHLPWRCLALRLLMVAGIPVVIGGWWYVVFYSRYGMLFGTHQTYYFQGIESPPGDLLHAFDFLQRFLTTIASATSTFLWSGTWSFLRRPLTDYLYCVPISALIIYGLATIRSRATAEEKQILAAAAALFLPYMAGAIYYMFTIVRYTGANSGLGGYYWFVAWPLLAVVVSIALKSPSGVKAILTILALASLTFFELTGSWNQLLLYSGILEKVGSEKTGVGWILPSPGNMLLVVRRLQDLSFPVLSLLLLATAILLRSILTCLMLFASPSPREGGG